MTDIIDQANDQAEMIANAYRAIRRPEGPRATGRCLFCEESVTDGRRWCDAECRDDWERENVS